MFKRQNDTDKDLKDELIDSFIEDNLYLNFVVEFLKGIK